MTSLTLCILIPFATALVCILAWKNLVIQRIAGVIGMAALLGTALTLFLQVSNDGIQTVQLGNWPAPFGITLVADLLAAIMVLVSSVIGLATAVYSLADINRERERYGYYGFLHLMMMGICGAFLTGDLFNMFVWFEVMLIASFVLMTLGGERLQMEGSVKYVLLNLVSSALFLAGIGILYGKTGTLNLADLSVRVGTMMDPSLLTITAMLFLVAFGVKAGIFPLFFWLPASYHTTPVAISAVFAGLLTKVGVYALIRVFTLVFTGDFAFTHTLLLILAGLTMVTGVLGAVAQFDFRRLLSFHIVSQIGYMLLGLALFTPLALAGTVFYLFHHIIVKANLFLISGVAERYNGTAYLKKMGGLYAATPLLAILFFIPAMSLGGIPPLSGFFAKFTLIKAALAGDTAFPIGGYILAGVALAVGLLTLFSMTKIWAEAFWKTPPNPVNAQAISPRDHVLLITPIASLAILTLCIGFMPEFFFDIAMRASQQLLDPSQYVQAVLPPSAP